MTTAMVQHEGDAVSVVEGTATVAALDGAAIDSQIATARAYPRSIQLFEEQVFALATRDIEIADAVSYALPRGKNRDGTPKIVEGPTVRFAEIVAYCWGNIRTDSRVIKVGLTHLTAQGTCIDLEKNVAARIEVQRRITKRNGTRYNDDMITVAGNAACSIALRNAIFKVIPFAFAKKAYDSARALAIGEGRPMGTRRTDALKAWSAAGGTDAQLYQILGVGGKADITVAHLRLVHGMITALENGDTTLDALIRSASSTEVSEADALFSDAPEAPAVKKLVPTADQVGELIAKAVKAEALTAEEATELVRSLEDPATDRAAMYADVGAKLDAQAIRADQLEIG